jgi:hypothetical protein
MHDEPRDTPEVDGDSSDVVTGPIGGASLVEPTKAEALSADLDQLPEIEASDDAPADTK